MKKFALIFSMVAFLSLQGFSQAGTCSYGLKLGPTFDWTSSSSAAAHNAGMGLGFNVGCVVDYFFTDHVAISSGLDFNYWRGHYIFSDLRMVPDFLEEVPVTVDRYVRGSYFEIPIMVKAKVGIADSWKAFAEAGVGLGINTGDLTKDAYSFYWISNADAGYNRDYFYQYRWFQAALNFGIGAEFQVNQKFNLFAQISFNHALNNTFTRDIESLTGSNLKTNYIGIEVGIMR